jgi:transmembrane sensor
MMPSQDTPDKQARDEALWWFVRINSGDATAADRADHAAWMALSVRNRREYAKLSGMWSDLDRIADPRTHSAAARVAVSGGLSRRGFLAAGSAAAATVAGYVAFNGLPDVLTSDHYTGIGERRSITLTDGTKVDLDAATAIALDFNDSSRRLRLVRGRAFFDVAKDAGRPFIVEAAGGSVTALGTRFVVHQWDRAVTVTVEESAVSVASPSREQVRIVAGHNVSYGADRLGSVQTSDVEAESAWRRGKLIFEDRPLSQVIADVNRYRTGTIRVTDESLLNLRVSGIFDVTEPDGVLEAIRSTLPVRVLEITRYLVLVRPA